MHPRQRLGQRVRIVDMKIINICLAVYLDGWGYQNNLLPEYEMKAGHEVVVIASSNHFPSYIDEKEKKKILEKGNDYYYNGVHIYRVKTFLNTTNLKFICTRIYHILKKEKPDIIFHHGINSSSLPICAFYKMREKGVKLYVDSHADSINESRYTLWNLVMIKGWLRMTTRLISPWVDRFLGVTPARCVYLNEAFGVSAKKISLLPIGGDTDTYDSIKQTVDEIKEEFKFPREAVIISSGGKMGKDKGTIELIKAFKTIRQDNFYLVLYGKFSDKETENLALNTEGVFYLGWRNRIDTLKILKMSNIAIWPIHHTTLIEDAVVSQTPLIVRKTLNTTHLMDGNGEFLSNGAKEEIEVAISKIIHNYDFYKSHTKNARDKIDYRKIANQVIMGIFSPTIAY